MTIESILSPDILGHRLDDTNVIEHHGVLGQKWGKRRFQNPDGSLTPEGRRRLGIKEQKRANKEAKAESKQQKKANKLEAQKRKIINKVDVEKFNKHLAKFSDREIQEFQTRKRILEQMNQKPDAESKFRSTVGKVSGTVDTARKLLDSYNRAAGLINDVTGEESVPVYSLEAKVKKKQKEYEDFINKVTPEEMLKNWDKIKPSSAEGLSKKIKAYDAARAYEDNRLKREAKAKEEQRIKDEEAEKTKTYTSLVPSIMSPRSPASAESYINNYWDKPISDIRVVPSTSDKVFFDTFMSSTVVTERE